MALSNSQYDQIMRDYEQKQLDNEYRLRERKKAAFLAIPELEELEHTVSSLSLCKARNLLEGDEDALFSLKEELHTLALKKQKLLAAHNLPADYLELHYECPDCQDTGYIGAHKCHCFKKAIIALLYEQSNIQEILAEENFSACSLDYYSPSHIDPLTGRSSLEAMQTALKICHEFVDTFSVEFHNICCMGTRE